MRHASVSHLPSAIRSGLLRRTLPFTASSAELFVTSDKVKRGTRPLMYGKARYPILVGGSLPVEKQHTSSVVCLITGWADRGHLTQALAIHARYLYIARKGKVDT